MTIEEKANAYDEALYKAKELIRKMNTYGFKCIEEDIEDLFSRSVESEDERIRKALINYFKVHNALVGENWNGIECDDVIAYLEKQKDASKAIEAVERIDKYIDQHLANAHDMKDSNPDKKYYRGWDDALGKMAGILQDVYSGEKQKESLRDFIDDFPYSDQKEQKSPENISHLPVQGKGVYKICPHCKERMVRDDSKVYTSMPPQYGYNCPKCGAMEFDTVIYDNPEMEEGKPVVTHGETYHVDTLGTQQVIAGKMPQKPAEWSEDIIRKAVKEVGLTQHQIDWFKTNVFLPKQEWSDEDEGELQNAIDALEFLGKKGVYKSESGYDAALQAASWLKSFKPQLKQERSKEDYHWEGLIRLLQNYQRTIDRKSNNMAYEDVECYISWLKSLRPHWKPSEEQMRALWGASERNDKLGSVLRNLYNDLKKL